MGVRQALERGTRHGVVRKGLGERFGELDLPRGRVERELDLDGVAGLDAGLLAHGPVQAEQKLPAHTGDRGPPGVAVYRRDDWKALGTLTHRGDLLVIEHDGGSRAAWHERRAQSNRTHTAILASEESRPSWPVG